MGVKVKVKAIAIFCESLTAALAAAAAALTLTPTASAFYKMQDTFFLFLFSSKSFENSLIEIDKLPLFIKLRPDVSVVPTKIFSTDTFLLQVKSNHKRLKGHFKVFSQIC